MKQELLTIFLSQKKQKDHIIEKLTPKISSAVHLVSDFSEEDILPILKNATMGSKLVLIGEWELVMRLKRLAVTTGFSDEEIIIKGLGDKEEQVFCVKCYQHSQKTEAKVITCHHCGQTLEVSKHYSKRHDAYLGFISL
ncbi:dimethylamine monooxygenase subunit DmmA family protein [Bacillus marasmi]|uniref:dimethylamine monooxygenase subunit DmmA family protein n=1 Tax=Bacillus marasmi TaxID=1926279 RepID=UPI0011C77E16|nr:dimethylamine monooxygenase subunit DmmA family protein [Bacillus marasmi]